MLRQMELSQQIPNDMSRPIQQLLCIPSEPFLNQTMRSRRNRSRPNFLQLIDELVKHLLQPMNRN